jgi:hypothetical protein
MLKPYLATPTGRVMRPREFRATLKALRARRIVCRGSGLRTPEARRAAPDVHERFAEAGR